MLTNIVFFFHFIIDFKSKPSLLKWTKDQSLKSHYTEQISFYRCTPRLYFRPKTSEPKVTQTQVYVNVWPYNIQHRERTNKPFKSKACIRSANMSGIEMTLERDKI